MTLSILNLLRKHRAHLADRNRTARIRAMVERLAEDDRDWLDATTDMQTGHALFLVERYLTQLPADAETARLVKDFAVRVTRRAYFLNRVSDAERAVQQGYSDNLRPFGGTDQ